MTELTDKLEKLIQQAALDGALTEDAVAQFHTLVKERNSLKEANEDWEKEHAELKGTHEELQRRLNVLVDEQNEISVRAAAIEEAEDEHRDREVRLECANLRIQDHQEMFRVVFRNAVIRRDIMTPNSINDAGVTSYATRDTVEEEDT